LTRLPNCRVCKDVKDSGEKETPVSE
jgi:hypothetical protein